MPIPLGGLDKDVPPKFVGYVEDGATALMIMRNGQDKQSLYEVSTKQGQVLGTVFEDKEGRYDIVSAPLLTAEGRPVAIPVVGEKTTYHWFDASLEKEYNVVVAQLPGNPSRVLIQAASKDWQKIVFSTSGNSTLPSLYLYDRSADKPIGVDVRKLPWCRYTSADKAEADYVYRSRRSVHTRLSEFAERVLRRKISPPSYFLMGVHTLVIQIDSTPGFSF